MTCRYCGTRNGDEDHRCARCGRRPDDTLTSAAPFVHGALATQLQPRVRVREQDSPGGESRVAPNFAGAVQRSLFQDRSSNVIPIASYAQPRAETKPRARAEAPARPAIQKRARQPIEEQGTLDFLPQAAAKPRQLGTTVEAVIYCEAPVATTLHRAVAAALDWSMVLIGY